MKPRRVFDVLEYLRRTWHNAHPLEYPWKVVCGPYTSLLFSHLMV